MSCVNVFNGSVSYTKYNIYQHITRGYDLLKRIFGFTYYYYSYRCGIKLELTEYIPRSHEHHIIYAFQKTRAQVHQDRVNDLLPPPPAHTRYFRYIYIEKKKQTRSRILNQDHLLSQVVSHLNS